MQTSYLNKYGTIFYNILTPSQNYEGLDLDYEKTVLKYNDISKNYEKFKFYGLPVNRKRKTLHQS
jgi:hypothetical protein